jgi:hypothetical protein
MRQKIIEGLLYRTFQLLGWALDRLEDHAERKARKG